MRSAPERSAAIYVVSHLEGREEEIVGHHWVYAGAAGRKRQASHLTDVCAAGDTLEDTRWSELSAIYKIWKEGPRTDVIGFCHYRRFFCFDKKSPSEAVITIDRHRLAAEIPMDWQKILEQVGPEKSIVPIEFDLGSSILSHYKKCHHLEDYAGLLNILKKISCNSSLYDGEID